MKYILCSDWLPERVSSPILPARDFPSFGPARKISVYCHVINPLLTKLDLSSWVNIGPVLFCILINLDFYSRSIKTHPAILISRLVNNAI